MESEAYLIDWIAQEDNIMFLWTYANLELSTVPEFVKLCRIILRRIKIYDLYSTTQSELSTVHEEVTLGISMALLYRASIELHPIAMRCTGQQHVIEILCSP